MVISVAVAALAAAIIEFAVRTIIMDARRMRSYRAWQLEQVGILASSFEPSDANRYRYYCYQQKVEGLRSKGPRGWVKP